MTTCHVGLVLGQQKGGRYQQFTTICKKIDPHTKYVFFEVMLFVFLTTLSALSSASILTSPANCYLRPTLLYPPIRCYVLLPSHFPFHPQWHLPRDGFPIQDGFVIIH